MLKNVKIDGEDGSPSHCISLGVYADKSLDGACPDGDGQKDCKNNYYSSYYAFAAGIAGLFVAFFLLFMSMGLLWGKLHFKGVKVAACVICALGFIVTLCAWVTYLCLPYSYGAWDSSDIGNGLIFYILGSLLFIPWLILFATWLKDVNFQFQVKLKFISVLFASTSLFSCYRGGCVLFLH